MRIRGWRNAPFKICFWQNEISIFIQENLNSKSELALILFAYYTLDTWILNTVHTSNGRGKFWDLFWSGLSCPQVGLHWISGVCSFSKFCAVSAGRAVTSRDRRRERSTKCRCFLGPYPGKKVKSLKSGPIFLCFFLECRIKDIETGIILLI